MQTDEPTSPAVPSAAVPRRVRTLPAGAEGRLRARSLAVLFAAGATLALLVLALPHGPDTNVAALAVVALDAYLIAGLLWLGAGKLPLWVLPVALAWGTVHITAVAYFAADTPSPLIFFYLWVFLYSAYFFSRRQTLAQVAFVGASYALLLAVLPPADGAVSWWVVAMGTLIVAAGLVIVLRGRVERLIAELYDAARTDSLTGLLNRRGFRELLDLELERAHRGGTSLSILVADVDGFKDVNDRAGHHVGDVILQRLVAVLEESKRRIDTASRVGGEEFTVILPGTDSPGAFVIAERARTAIEREFQDDIVPVTISFGIATYPATAATAAALLVAGDEALYAAKQGGRNRSVIHSREVRERLAAGTRHRDIEAERFLAAVLELAEVVDLRFSGSARHAETVGRYAEMMAAELGFAERRVERVRLAGILHDVGKVGVPDAILRKPGSLEEEEWELIRRHPQLGADILEHPSLQEVRQWVRAHHERPDGRGYPFGLSGGELSVESQIIAVADAYEAMTSDRSYRSSLGHEGARIELLRHAGTQFDSEVVAVLLRALDRKAESADTASVALS